MSGGPRRPRVVANLAWIVLGVVLYAVCVGVFGGYPQVHSELLTWVAIAVLALLGALVWYRHERSDDEP